MPTTSGGLRYPASTDAVNVPGDIQNLALDVDTRFASISGLPSQGSNAGKFLQTDGSVASWASIPTDATRAPLASPALTGTPTAPTAAVGNNSTQIATTAFVLGQGNSTAATISMNGVQAAGSSNLYARADHVHPTDTSRAASVHTHDSSQVPTVVFSVQTGSYTLALTDAGDVVEMGSASAQTLTIPLDSSVDFAVGTKIDVIQTGAGECSIAPTSGVTLESEGGKRKVNARWQAVTLIKRAANSWVLLGALKA